VKITNILVTGVGGQGLVLTTKLLAEAAFIEGYDLKTSDVIGLSQRGGAVWGSVRFGEKVHSALIPEGEVDILLAMEQLEALRWTHTLKKDAKIILNNQCIYLNQVLIEKKDYPDNIAGKLQSLGFDVISVNAIDAAKAIGNIKVINLILLGKLSLYLPFSEETWLRVIEKNMSQNIADINKKAFFIEKSLNS
jgi:indolepyruvate ferredoxin oxidoreductase beta subunit